MRMTTKFWSVTGDSISGESMCGFDDRSSTDISPAWG
jgi:hypothetical protein